MTIAASLMAAACAVVSPVPSTLAPTSGRGSTPPVTGCGGGEAPIDPGGVVPSPACSEPGPTGTPWPVSGQQAVAAAAALLGRPDLALTWASAASTPAYIVGGADRGAVVDGTTGRVVEFFALEPPVGLPDGAIPVWSPRPAATGGPVDNATLALVRARDFLVGRHLVAAGSEGQAVLVPGPGEPVWRVSLADAATSRVIEAWVSSGGEVTGYLEPDPPLVLALPRIDRDAAIRLALARAAVVTGRQDQEVISAEFWPTFVGDTQRSTWSIGTGVPVVDATSHEVVWWFGTAIEVDAVSGSLTVVKAP